MRKRAISQANRDSVVANRLVSEHLESRNMLAGAIAASVVDGTLTVLGDGLDNSIMISTFNDPVDGEGFRIQGQNKNGATMVNGGAGPAEFFGVTNLAVDLFGGNDELTITNDLAVMLACLDSGAEVAPISSVDVPGRAVINMGDGTNRVDMGSVSTGYQLLLRGGNASDTFRFCGVDVGTNLTVQTFGGDDGVHIHNSSSARVTNIRTANGDSDVAIDGLAALDLFVIGGNHEDNVSFNDLSLSDDLTVQGYRGTDEVDFGVITSFPWPVLTAETSVVGDFANLQMGDGNSTVDVRFLSAGQLTVVGGIHSDFVRLQTVSTARRIYVNTLDGADDVQFFSVDVNQGVWVSLGAGDDAAFFTNTTVANNFAIDAGLGNDDVEFANVDIDDNLYVYLVADNDDLTIDGSSAANAWLFAGAGFDRYFRGSNSFGSEHTFDFEQVF